MANKLSNQGRYVVGALATFLADRLAADENFKPNELQALVSDLPVADYADQVPIVIDRVAKQFKGRLAQDAKLDGLHLILDAVKAEDDEEDDDLESPEEEREKKEKKDKEDDEDEAEDKKAKDRKAKDKKLKDAKRAYDAARKAAMEDEDDEEAMDKLMDARKMFQDAKAACDGGEVEDKKAKDKAKDKAEPGAFGKPAMDEAMITRNIEQRMAEKAAAAEKVRPVIGKIDAFAMDSAASIFKMALEAIDKDNKTKLRKVHPSAYEVLFDQAMTKRVQAKPNAPRIALDSKVTSLKARVDNHMKSV